MLNKIIHDEKITHKKESGGKISWRNVEILIESNRHRQFCKHFIE